MKHKLFGAAVAALALITAAPAFAQTTDSSPPSHRRLELAKEVMDATGMRKQFSGMFQNIVSQAMASATKNLPAAAKARADAFVQAESDVMSKYAPQFIDMAQNAYAETYTEQELSDILAFYQTPSGQAMTAKAPLMMQNMMGGMMTLMPKIQHEVAEEACAKVACTAAERRVLLGAAGAS